MSPTKLLQINPTLFSVNSSGNNKSLKNKAVKPQITNNKMNPNRKVLLAKIKDFQKKDRENKQKEKQNNSNSTENEKEEIDDFEGEFNKSLNFLQELSNKHTLKRKEKKNRTLKKPIDVGNNVNLELPNELKENEITILPSVSSILDQKQPIKNEQLEPSNIQNTIANTTSTNTSTNSNSNSNANRIEDNAITNLQKPLIQKPIQNLVLSSSLPLPPPIQISQPLQSTSITSSPPPIILSGPPPYSNLKGTVKPTYREWIQKTQKNYKNKNSKKVID